MTAYLFKAVINKYRNTCLNTRLAYLTTKFGIHFNHCEKSICLHLKIINYLLLAIHTIHKYNIYYFIIIQ